MGTSVYVNSTLPDSITDRSMMSLMTFKRCSSESLMWSTYSFYISFSNFPKTSSWRMLEKPMTAFRGCSYLAADIREEFRFHPVFHFGYFAGRV